MPLTNDDDDKRLITGFEHAHIYSSEGGKKEYILNLKGKKQGIKNREKNEKALETRRKLGLKQFTATHRAAAFPFSNHQKSCFHA